MVNLDLIPKSTLKFVTFSADTYRLDVLLEVQIHDNSVETEYTDQFQQTEQLELFGLFRIQENLLTNKNIQVSQLE